MTDKCKTDGGDAKKESSPKSNKTSSGKDGAKSPRTDRPGSSTGSTSAVDENGNKSKPSETAEPSTSAASSSTSSSSTTSSSTAALTMPPTFPSMLTSPGRCMPGLPGVYPPLGFPPMGFPPTSSSFQHHMAAAAFGSGYPSLPFGGSFGGAAAAAAAANPFGQRCVDPMCKGCPSNMFGMAAAAGRSTCVTPGCTQCSMHHPQADLASLWMTYQQSMLAAGHSLPPPPTGSSSLQSLMGVSGSGKHMCNWVEGPSGICAKTFASPEELMAHMRTHATADQGKASHANPLLPMTGRVSPRSSYLNALRFHPYSKFPVTSLPSSMPLAPHLPFPSPLSPVSAVSNYQAALSALYGQQRLMGSLPHQ